ncbi:MAG: polysaccharide biosynthesis protein [Candidatus Limiplasma sp.]|nr:polysaccharide biosynthesis protein [Candidatus Limiplasma sp.]
MSEKQKSIVGGMTVLTAVGLICKVMGALYNIPLAWIIGKTGLALYQLVFPTYNMLLTLSSAGIPVAISRMVSYSLAQDDPRNAKRIFRVAQNLLIVLGTVSTLLMVVFSPSLASRVGDPSTTWGFVAIAPSVGLVCAMSAFRGLMQGQQNMVPTAISQLIEQVGKVVIILPLAYVGMRMSVVHAAAFVLLGTTLSEAAALLYMGVVYRRNQKSFGLRPQNDALPRQSDRSLTRQLLNISVPVALGSLVIPLSSFIDSGMLLNRLMDSGMTLETARPLYGQYSAYVIALINVPTALSIAIAMSLVPAISSAMARGDEDWMRRQCAMGLRYAFLLGLPCSAGMSLLSSRLLSMIFPFDSAAELRTIADLLSLSSLTIILFTVVQSTEGILQGLRKQRVPMFTLIAGVVVKIVLNYILIGTPSINMFGAPLASIACYTVAMVPNLYFTYKYAKLKMDFMGTIGRPLLATAGMGLVIWLGNRFLPQGRLWTALLLLVAVAAYGVMALWTGAMTKDDLKPFLGRLGRGKRANA